MSIYKIFPTSDTTLYSAYPSANAGLDEILEVSVKNADVVTSTDDIRRSIVKFNSTDLQKLQTLKGSNTYDVYLRLFLANAANLSTDYNLEFTQVNTLWDMGTGKFLDNPNPKNGACWYSTSSYVSTTNSWPNPSFYITPGGGSWTGNAISQSFTYTDSKDINVKVTTIFNNWIAGATNGGILIKHTSSIENDSTSEKVLNFFSRDTHTIFPPCLEIRWDDSSYNTGSLQVMQNDDSIINITNNPYQIKWDTQKYKFRISTRDKYPVRQFITSSLYTVNKALPSSSYWGLQDVKTEDMIIDFDDNYTKISCDPTSSFFNMYINGLEPERYYKIIVKSLLNSGETIVIDNDCIFKVIK
jgi:hypothetical protein